MRSCCVPNLPVPQTLPQAQAGAGALCTCGTERAIRWQVCALWFQWPSAKVRPLSAFSGCPLLSPLRQRLLSQTHSTTSRRAGLHSLPSQPLRLSTNFTMSQTEVPAARRRGGIFSLFRGTLSQPYPIPNPHRHVVADGPSNTQSLFAAKHTSAKPPPAFFR